MSYNCIECGEKLIKADKPKIVKSELGFSIQIFPFQILLIPSPGPHPVPS